MVVTSALRTKGGPAPLLHSRRPPPTPPSPPPGELVVLAPGVRRFGEKDAIDALIRRHGYHSTAAVRAAMAADAELRDNLVAAAHMMLSSSEGRFTITYCPPPLDAAAEGEEGGEGGGGGLSRTDIEATGFAFGDLAAQLARYDPARMRPGANVMPDGERVFWVPNPAAGLWAARERFADAAAPAVAATSPSGPSGQ